MWHFFVKLSILLSFYNVSAVAETAQVLLGERLFNEARFSRDFAQNAVDINDTSSQIGTSCVSCHQIDQQYQAGRNLGMRIYADFTPSSPVPLRLEDKISKTLRNTPGLVGIGSPYLQQRFSHWDGEFSDHSQTVLGNFSGRNMGWLPQEKNQALAHIVEVMQKDDGQGALAQEFGGAYQKVLLGIDPSIPDELRLDKKDRLDVFKASQEKILALVVRLVTAYLDDLDFEKNDRQHYIGSPYDKFLAANNLPAAPRKQQTVHQYMQELRASFIKIKQPRFIAKKYFSTHKKELGFGAQEWAGLQVFFNLPKADGSLHQGMCLSCHKPPLFTDEKFHNVGITQFEYDNVHGEGGFSHLALPELSNRDSRRRFEQADLGVWEFFARKNKPSLTQYLRNLFCWNNQPCNNNDILPRLVGRFKTPGLRNLNHSDPYFHNGSSPHLMHLLHQYKRASELMRKGELRNGDPLLKNMQLGHYEIHALSAFLESLNEDYD